MATFTEEEKAYMKTHGGKLSAAHIARRKSGHTQRVLGTGAFDPNFVPSTPQAAAIAQSQGAPLDPRSLALSGSNTGYAPGSFVPSGRAVPGGFGQAPGTGTITTNGRTMLGEPSYSGIPRLDPHSLALSGSNTGVPPGTFIPRPGGVLGSESPVPYSPTQVNKPGVAERPISPRSPDTGNIVSRQDRQVRGGTTGPNAPWGYDGLGIPLAFDPSKFSPVFGFAPDNPLRPGAPRRGTTRPGPPRSPSTRSDAPPYRETQSVERTSPHIVRAQDMADRGDVEAALANLDVIIDSPYSTVSERQEAMNARAEIVRNNQITEGAGRLGDRVDYTRQAEIDALSTFADRLANQERYDFNADPFVRDQLSRISSLYSSEPIDASTEAQLRGRAADRIKGEATVTKQRIQEDLLRRGILDSGLQAGIERQTSQEVAKNIASEEREIGIQRALARSQQKLAATQIGAALTGQIGQVGLGAAGLQQRGLEAAGGLTGQQAQLNLKVAGDEFGRQAVVEDILLGRNQYVPDLQGLFFTDRERQDYMEQFEEMKRQFGEEQGSAIFFSILEMFLPFAISASGRGGAFGSF
jgi:hypothetical protein